MEKKLAAVLAAAVALSLWPVPAASHDHKRPRVVLRSPGDRQIVVPWTGTWIRHGNDGLCVITHWDGFGNPPRRAMTWRPRRKIHLRLFKRHKPRRLAIRMYVRLNDSGDLAGRGRKADVRLRRAWRGGRRIWIAGFFGRRDARRHLYLVVKVRYRDVEGCGGSQRMTLTYHLRRRGS